MNRIVIVFITLVLMVSTGCNSSPEISGRKAVLIIPEQVMDAELAGVQKALESIGFSTTTASLSLDPITSNDGAVLNPQMLISEVQEQDYEVIVGIGGMGIFDILENEEIINLFREFHAAGKYTTAICGSSAILANAGLLNGVEATTYPNDMLINILKDNGAIYIDKAVVISGKIITGNGPDASIAFGEALASALK